MNNNSYTMEQIIEWWKCCSMQFPGKDCGACPMEVECSYSEDADESDELHRRIALRAAELLNDAMAREKQHTSTATRPCIYDGKSFAFHRWIDVANVVPPSPMVGGAPGGQFWNVNALIESGDGKVITAYPKDIAFDDSMPSPPEEVKQDA